MRNIRVIFYPAPATPLTPAEIEHIFAQHSPADPVMVALRQLLVEQVASATVDAATARLTEREAGHAAGRLHELSTLQSRLDALLTKGQVLRRSRAVDKVPRQRTAPGSGG